MKNDELLNALADAARADDEAEDPRWDALARGTISEQDRAELTARAETSEVARFALEAFSPLDGGAKERITDRLLLEVAKSKPASKREGGLALVPGSERRRAPASINAPPPSSKRTRMLFALALAAAFGGVGLLGGGRGAAVALPAYEIEVRGGDKDVRKAPEIVGKAPAARPPAGAPPQLGPGSRLDIQLRPSSRVPGPIAARAFLLRDGRVQPSSAPLAIADGGAVRFAGAREALFPGVADGPLTVIIAVGSEASLPDAAAVEATIRNGDDPRGYRLLKCDVILDQGSGVTRDEGE